MYELGFEYVNAFSSTSTEFGLGTDSDRDVGLTNNNAKHTSNIVFKKRHDNKNAVIAGNWKAN